MVGKEKWIDSLVAKVENEKLVLVDKYHMGAEYVIDLSQNKFAGLSVNEADALHRKINEFFVSVEDAVRKKVEAEEGKLPIPLSKKPKKRLFMTLKEEREVVLGGKKKKRVKKKLGTLTRKCTGCGKSYSARFGSEQVKAKLCKNCYSRSRHTEAALKRVR